MALADSKFDNLSVAYIDSLIDDANYSQKHQKILLGEYRFWRARLLNFETMCLQEPLSLTTGGTGGIKDSIFPTLCHIFSISLGTYRESLFWFIQMYRFHRSVGLISNTAFTKQKSGAEDSLARYYKPSQWFAFKEHRFHSWPRETII